MVLGATPLEAYWRWRHKERQHQRNEFERAQRQWRRLLSPGSLAA